MKTIVFDFGGVLFEWQPREFIRRLLPELAHDEASTTHWLAQIYQSYGGDWGEFDRGTLAVPELVQRISARTGLSPERTLHVVEATAWELQPIANSVQLLAKLRAAGHRLFFLSNMPAPYAAYLQRENEFISWFEGGIFSAHVQHIKPEPAIFDLAVQRFGGNASDLVFLDDVAHNVEKARHMGWNAVLFKDAQQAEAEMRSKGWVAT